MDIALTDRAPLEPVFGAIDGLLQTLALSGESMPPELEEQWQAWRAGESVPGGKVAGEPEPLSPTTKLISGKDADLNP